MLLAENYSASTVGRVNGVLWSVVVEVAFYLLLPFIALGIARAARGSRTRAAAVIAAIGAVSFAFWYGKVFHGNDPVWRYNLPATFFFFTGGMLVAVLRTSWREHLPGWVGRPFDSSDFWFLATAPLWLIVIWRYHYSFVIALAAAIMVAACVLPFRHGLVTRFLEWRPLALLGVASYSLYIWHSPLLNALTSPSYATVSWVPGGTLGLAAVTVPLAIAIAFVSYGLIERPFLRLRRRWASASVCNVGGEVRGRMTKGLSMPVIELQAAKWTREDGPDPVPADR